MATCLSALTRLESLNLELDFPRFPTNRGSRHDLPPPTRTVFPAHTEFRFQGKNAYLDSEDLIVRIEAPNQQTRYSVCHGSRGGGLQCFATRQVLSVAQKLSERLNLLNQAEIMFFDSSTRIIINSGSPLSST